MNPSSSGKDSSASLDDFFYAENFQAYQYDDQAPFESVARTNINAWSFRDYESCNDGYTMNKKSLSGRYRQSSVRRTDDKSYKSRSEENLKSRDILLRVEHKSESIISFSEDERIVFRLVSCKDANKLKEFLYFNTSMMNLTNLIDNSGFSLLHLAVYKNSLDMT